MIILLFLWKIIQFKFQKLHFETNYNDDNATFLSTQFPFILGWNTSMGFLRRIQNILILNKGLNITMKFQAQWKELPSANKDKLHFKMKRYR